MHKNRPISGTKSHLAARVHLCPRCTQPLSAGRYRCENCRLRFKSKIFAGILALLFPGGGYWYIRQYLLAFLNTIVEIFLFSYAAFLLKFAGGNFQTNPVFLTSAAAAFLLVKIIALIHSGHFTDEFIPTKKNIKPMPR